VLHAHRQESVGRPVDVFVQFAQRERVIPELEDDMVRVLPRLVLDDFCEYTVMLSVFLHFP